MKNLKNIESLVIVLLMQISVFAQDYYINGIYYALNSGNKTLTVTNKNAGSSYSGIVNIPSYITINQKTYKVTSIGAQAFSNCQGLTSVVIPNTITKIGWGAFRGCSSLTSIEIPNSITEISDNCFRSCSSLISIEISNGVTSIGSNAFYGCYSLMSIEIPTSITSIGGNAFSYCSNLTEVIIPDSVTTIGGFAFESCTNLTTATIGKGVTSVDIGIFSKCSKLKTLNYNAENCDGGSGIQNSSYTWLSGCDNIEIVNIGESVKMIPDYFLYNNKNVATITIPYNVTYISSTAFNGCTNLTTLNYNADSCYISSNWLDNCNNLKIVNIGENVKIIPNYFIYNKNKIEAIDIPSNITSIGSRAFSGCTSLTNIKIPNSVTSIGDYAFSGCVVLANMEIPNSVTSIGSSTFLGCTGLINIEIPNSVTSIGNSTFSGCTGLANIEIPNSVDSIGYRLFYGCINLKNVNISNSITAIGDYAFYNCWKVNIELPDNLTYIGQGSFYGCLNIKGKLVIPKDVVSIGSGAFASCGPIDTIIMLGECPITGYNVFGNIAYSTLIYVPCGEMYLYSIHDYWKKFYNKKELIYTIKVSSQNSTQGVVNILQEPSCFGTEAKIEAVAVKGYHFSKWSDGNTDNPRSVVVTQDTSFTAYFEIDSFFVSVLSNDNIAGTTDGSGIYDYNSEAVISATANKHYHFVSWSDGNTSNPRIVTIDKDSVFTALFEEDNKYHIQVISSNNTMGTTEGEGVYYEGEQMQIKAVANEHYIFKEWSDGNTSNPRTITVLSDNVYIANFEKESSLQNVSELSQIQIYPNPAKDVVFIENVVCSTEYITINIYDNKGGLVLTETRPNATSYTLNTTLLKSDVYYLRLVGVENSRVFKLIKE